jgi:hypothetical protein
VSAVNRGLGQGILALPAKDAAKRATVAI